MLVEQFPTEKYPHGWIEVICGSMFSGKTEELIRRLKRAEFANQALVLFKPAVDNRYSAQNVVSHRGAEFEAVVLQEANKALELVKDEKVVAFDETQFFDEGIVRVCEVLANQGKRVIIAGLDMDFSGNPFGSMPYLLAKAEYITKVHAICTSCGSLAYLSHRLIERNEQVLLGAKEEYTPLCRKCYIEKNKHA